VAPRRPARSHQSLFLLRFHPVSWQIALSRGVPSSYLPMRLVDLDASRHHDVQNREHETREPVACGLTCPSAVVLALFTVAAHKAAGRRDETQERSVSNRRVTAIPAFTPSVSSTASIIQHAFRACCPPFGIGRDRMQPEKTYSGGCGQILVYETETETGQTRVLPADQAERMADGVSVSPD
jgi:hypothetical protein